jgi:hypothetical protein
LQLRQESKSTSSPTFSKPTSHSQPETSSEPLERYLKDATVLVPEFSRSTQSPEIEAKARMKAILDAHNV